MCFPKRSGWTICHGNQSVLSLGLGFPLKLLLRNTLYQHLIVCNVFPKFHVTLLSNRYNCPCPWHQLHGHAIDLFLGIGNTVSNSRKFNLIVWTLISFTFLNVIAVSGTFGQLIIFNQIILQHQIVVLLMAKYS